MARSYSPWPWTESLGGLRPGEERTYAVRRILFGLVEGRCRELGLAEGERVRCRHRDRDEVVLELASGELRHLNLHYAWFVQVEPVPDAAVH